MFSHTEENYLKVIYHLSKEETDSVTTNAIAKSISTRAASVNNMVKRLASKGALFYRKYQGVSISDDGRKEALKIIRKHRLWEMFLVEKLRFNWDEVHEVAEQLEHVKSPLLVKRLDEFLAYPKFDPHGNPIPDENGNLYQKPHILLSKCRNDHEGILMAVNDSSAGFLQYLDKIGLYIGAKIKIIGKIEFDKSIEIKIDSKETMFISKEVSQNVIISHEY